MKTKVLEQMADPHVELFKMARVGLGMTVRDLADLAQVNKATIVRIEAGMNVRGTTIGSVREVLEAKGARFWIDLSSNEGSVSLPAKC